MTLDEFAARCEPFAAQCRDASLRNCSAPRVRGSLFENEYTMAAAVAWPFIYRQLSGHFPWER